jgi:predicted porin
LTIGKMWMPDCNAIAYSVQMFSSYYRGFATYTTFHKGDTIAYCTPSLAGFSAAAAYSDDNGAADSSGNPDDRWQATLSYIIGDRTLSGGLGDLGGANAQETAAITTKCGGDVVAAGLRYDFGAR